MQPINDKLASRLGTISDINSHELRRPKIYAWEVLAHGADEIVPAGPGIS